MPNVDRLARGYVRQELRPLKQTSGQQVETAFLKDHRHVFETYFSRNKRLPESLPPTLVKTMVESYFPRLIPVGTLPKDLEFPGIRAKNVHQANVLYWEANEHELTGLNEGEVGFDDNTVDLRFTRIIADRKRVIIDDHLLPVSVSEHALARMSERKFSVERPLAAFSEEMDRWLPMSIAFLFAGIALKKLFGIGIPVGDGMVLGCVVAQSTKPRSDRYSTDLHINRRVQADNRGVYFADPKRQDFFNIEAHRTVLLRISTFISAKQLSWEQEWARDRMCRIMEKHHEVMPVITQTIIEGQPIEAEQADAVRYMLADLVRLVEDDVWNESIRIPSSNTF